MAEINDNKLSSDLNECKINLINSEKENDKLTKNISSLELQYTNCNKNLNTYKSNYQTCQNEKSTLDSKVNSLSSQVAQLENDYNSCYNQLSYYTNLQEEYKKCKENNEQLTQSINSCYSELDLWINDCYVEYNGLTQDMKSTINELIVYSYNSYSDFEQRAKYIRNRMSQIYNKTQWSCILAKTNAYYGYYVRYVNDLYYTYTYKSINWVVFTGSSF